MGSGALDRAAEAGGDLATSERWKNTSRTPGPPEGAGTASSTKPQPLLGLNDLTRATRAGPARGPFPHRPSPRKHGQHLPARVRGRIQRGLVLIRS